MSKQSIEFFFELSSPYSYLAATQLAALSARFNASVLWKPVVLGAIFKQTGNAMPASIPAKGAYMLHDLTRWASHYNVPITMPASFPVNAITAHRALLAVQREHGDEAMAELAMTCFAAFWARGEDISSPEVLAPLIANAGFDTEAILGLTQNPDIKARLRAHTDDAIARGVFGAPTLFVGDEMFWGNDRLHFVEAALAKHSA